MTMPDIKVNHHRSTPITVDEQTAKLKSKLLKDIKRSAYVYRVDCGGCNGCEIEIFSAITPVFDAERFGIKVVPSPRHADILLFTGAVTRAMRVPALRAYESAPDPKICISYGACGCGGGIFHDLYCVWGGSESIVPIDVWIPGCPPTPAATLYGFAVALGLLEQKLKGENHLEQVGEKAALLLPGIPLHTRVLIEREARRLAGYYQGRIISDRFLSLLAGASMDAATLRLEEWLKQENDPRLREIVACLVDCLQQELTHAK
ncbi:MULTISPECIES: NADH-quinone oxidoreductase subunit B family protein [Serratia]|jgi:hydrogenase-4 component I|uniref:NADH-quinone oxidoreductase subunit B family protein n=1 Tax=Serratia TaxID=613 RepID=UPI000E0F2942|nr:NADH-quinone oxidoreductase subunit B family protein [Serratia fonticola]MBP0995658.1 NADH-quinone oxidoreductase subunit B family protein [Serratia fonticola]MBP1000924.1 NADH-quinone oxidoreductase subunit B family protein [Serratia fonticola]MBP1010519.1 NADH-quinone oxidoreductase subunit B family protein [Serratia fonticola]MBP1016151.1 NADH-quinone oxidoreductase subunit B family protein [Serratia fonticola]MBP1035084.1 NADH-quinone oxidoreductase subunit B family protein [Serratia fo